MASPDRFYQRLNFLGMTAALLHVAILIACTILLVEAVLIRFRKIPFTYSYPPFQSHSALILVAYLFWLPLFHRLTSPEANGDGG